VAAAPPSPGTRHAVARLPRTLRCRTSANDGLIPGTIRHEIPANERGAELVGGLGSGGWNRTARSTTSELRRIDVNELLRSKILNGPCSITTTWSRHGEKVASIGIFGGRDRIHLHYRQQSAGETEWRQVAEDIAIDWRPNRYGGRVPLFRCPGCRVHPRVLLGAGLPYSGGDWGPE
jgi:hypothetical protein